MDLRGVVEEAMMGMRQLHTTTTGTTTTTIEID